MVSWEIVSKATSFIAEEMGVALRRSSLSPNIKERSDHSCAVADDKGNIVAQAEHIPVHLGSLRIGIKNLLSEIKKKEIEINEGDMIVSNDPFITGTHLNDVTLLAPIFHNDKIIGYVANKAHHIDIGGPIYGSINPFASTIYDEGFIIPPVKIVENGVLRRDLLDVFLSNVKVPKISEGDFKAQIAANMTGIRRIKEAIARYGVKNLMEGWESTILHTYKLSIDEISKWPSGEYVAEDYLEVGEKEIVGLKAKVKIGNDKVEVEFQDVPEQIDKPFNAVFGVTFSAVSFAVRSIIKQEIPVNEGFYSIIEIKAKKGTMLNPLPPAPVSGGNLETSQRIADLIFLALSKAMPSLVPAAGSGTMMNVMMGGFDSFRKQRWAYYETIGGGTGGRPDSDGVSGVHVDMTNTMNTPIEVAEATYPIIFTSYRIREGSGGDGIHKGGDGIIRSFKVLSKTKVSIMGSRFLTSPWGLKGGKPGKRARVIVRKANGEEILLNPMFTLLLDEGDEIIIETPGGGGYGNKNG
ncbi:MAG: hydantoinase B/oxoprolinase family protein [Caldisphaeraceae archaeon]|nr:hydantoinase B/oxoprolinase family protein [Caldisphaeraceae archaeon]